MSHTLHRHPPSPKARFFIGQLPHMLGIRRDSLGFLQQCVSDYGDVVRLKYGKLEVLLVNHPDLVEQVMLGANKHFIKDRTTPTSRAFRRLLGNGLLTSDGDFWLRQRRLAQQAFHKDRILQTYSGAFVRHCETMLDGWESGSVRDMYGDMMKLTLEIAAETFFGSDVSDRAGDIGRALNDIMDDFVARGSKIPLPDDFPSPTNRRFDRATAALDKIVFKIIEERRAQEKDGEGGRNDLLTLLMRAQDSDDSQMTDRQLRDEGVTLFLAGHETTALALSWIGFLLAQHPEIQARLHAEVDEVLGGRTPTVDDLEKLPLVNNIVTETMRLYPPVWRVARQAMHDTQIGEYKVKKGAVVIVSQWLLHRDERFYDHPDQFRPDRWTDEMKKKLPRYAYFPFGGGPRICIAANFASLESALLLATIARRFSFALPDGYDPHGSPQPSVTLRPARRIDLKVTTR
ncbi:MAG TPA: cytochrome P450 [Abditibacteriaceae bacterium]|jgi:cytochrome P450